MIPFLRPIAAITLVTAVSCNATPDFNQALPEGAAALLEVNADEVPDFAGDWTFRNELLPALEQSIAWIDRPHAKRFFPIEGVTWDRARQSLLRFRELLIESTSRNAFEVAVRREFSWYKSAGWDGRGGGVLFTGYCTPLLEGSMTRQGDYQFPLYALPQDLEKDSSGKTLGWRVASSKEPLPYPGRSVIDAGGLLANKGLELVWLSNRLDAFIAHVNGSAFVRLENGEVYRLGYAGKNGAPYHSLGKELIRDGVLPPDGLNLQRIRDWAETVSPEVVQGYLNRNPSYVFFQPIPGTPHGSIDVPVTARRSIATDKTIFPRASICFVEVGLPGSAPQEVIPMNQFLMDQDTGGAIRSAGRTDLYMGIGPDAEAFAGRIKSEGQLYYLFLKK